MWTMTSAKISLYVAVKKITHIIVFHNHWSQASGNFSTLFEHIKLCRHRFSWHVTQSAVSPEKQANFRSFSCIHLNVHKTNIYRLNIPLHFKASILIFGLGFILLVSDSVMLKRRSCHIQALAVESGTRTLRWMHKTGLYREIRKKEVWTFSGIGKWNSKFTRWHWFCPPWFFLRWR